MGKIQGNHKAIRALGPEEARGGSSYQNPGSKVCGECHPTGPLTFNHPGQPTSRKGATEIKPQHHPPKSAGLLLELPLANPTKSQRSKEPLGAIQTGQGPGAESRVNKGREQI